MKLVEYTRFYDYNGELLGEEVDDNSCVPYLTNYCGGCYRCIMMQTCHYGFDGVILTGERWLLMS